MPSTHDLRLLAPLQPPSATRAWQSAPHPYLPLVATCSSDRCVRVYSLKTFRQHSTIEGGHKRSIRTCAWKPSAPRKGGGGESILVTGSFDASAGVWRRWNEGVVGQAVAELDDRDGEYGGDDDDWQFAVILEGHDSEIKSVAWSASGSFLATCSRDKSVWVWEEVDHGGNGGDDDFETIAVLQDHEADVKCVTWHPSEDLLASSSYDETIRLYREEAGEDDWLCVSVLNGHDGTVWAVDFEGNDLPGLESSVTSSRNEISPLSEREECLQERRASGPRLISCSDDLSIRVWRRRPPSDAAENASDGHNGVGEQPHKKIKYPSTIRPGRHSLEQDWFQEDILPKQHDRAILCVAWSKKTGRIVSAGSDGKIMIYEERWLQETADSTASVQDSSGDGDAVDDGKMDVDTEDGHRKNDARGMKLTQWVVVAEKEAAHDVYEVNHVCWAKRFDSDRRQSSGDDEADEEMVISTGDDGVANVWVLSHRKK
ncbi:MAG: Cytosolic iron-sulfur protein assembly protein [Lichina confinis]|nr:MAG: Cytosolic iron-sulfur protein assembly protein [Lichina confinis]